MTFLWDHAFLLDASQVDTSARKVFLGGVLIAVHVLLTRQGEQMCLAQLEDETGMIRLTVFPAISQKTTDIWQEDKVVLVEGAVQAYKDELTLVCRRAKALASPSPEKPRPQTLRMTLRVSGTDQEARANAQRLVQAVYDCLASFPGEDSYEIVVSSNTADVLLIPKEPLTRCDPALIARLEAIVGKGQVEMREV